MREGLAARQAAAAIRRRTSLASDRRGATIVEFGFICLPLFALLIAIVQTSLTFFAQQNLDTTSEKAVRQLMTGSAQKSGMTQSQFRTAVCSKLPAFMKCEKVMVDVQVATSFSAANTSAPTITYDASGNPNNSWSYSPGGPGDIVIVKVMYIWDVNKGPLGFDLSTLSANKRLLVSTSVFKTEPYTI